MFQVSAFIDILPFCQCVVTACCRVGRTFLRAGGSRRENARERLAPDRMPSKRGQEDERGRQVVAQRAGRWLEITPSPFPHETEGVNRIKAVLPNHAPFRAWSNFEFRDGHGKWHEIDLVAPGRRRLHLVQPGRPRLRRQPRRLHPRAADSAPDPGRPVAGELAAWRPEPATRGRKTRA